MKALAEFLVRSVVTHKDDVRIDATEGEASILIELRVHPDDLARLREDGDAILHAMQSVLSAASGDRRAVLDLVDPSSAATAPAAASGEAGGEGGAEPQP